MSTALAVKLEREKRKTDREKWTRDLLRETILSPNMLRLAMVAGIIAYATSEARSSENVGPVRSALAFALPGIGIPMIAADAGITDKWALAGISAASVGYVTGQMLTGWTEAMAGSPIPLPTVPNIFSWFKNVGGPGYAPWD